MQVTWSDINSKENDSTTSKDARYDPNDFLAFVALVESIRDSDCDSESDDELTDDYKIYFYE